MKAPCIFWNLQKLFEPELSPLSRALGTTSQNWTEELYRIKIANIAACLLRMTDGEEPMLLAFAEVESLRITKDIVERTGWEHLISTDEIAPASELEGLDVVLMYNSQYFDQIPLKVQSFSLNNNYSTRDLLYARLRLKDRSTEVEVYVAHWPSRVISEGYILRMAHSFFLNNLVIKSLKFSKSEILREDGSYDFPSEYALLKRWNTPCIIMGDFNDEPFDESIRDALKTTRDVDFVLKRGELKGKALTDPENYLEEKFILFNPCWSLRFSDSETIGGSYYRSPEWKIYDQVILSHGLLMENASMKLETQSINIPRLEEFSEGGQTVSMLTRNGYPKEFSSSSTDGVSDHFPVYFSIEVDT